MINIGTLLATLAARDQLTPVLSQVSRSVTTTGDKIRRLGTNVQGVGVALSAGITAPLAGMAAAAVTSFADFESGMNRVKALSGATGTDFAALEQQALTLGQTTQFSATQAADAMGFLAMAGFDTNQIVGSMPGVLQLAAASQIDLASAADITTNIMTGYGRTTDQVARTNDILVTALTSANVDLSQLGQAFRFVGPVAAGAGLEFSQTAAAIALMGNAGIQGGLAGRALRRALVNLQNPSKSVKDAMAEISLKVKDANDNLLPLDNILQQLEVSGADSTQVMRIFGTEAGPAMVSLLSQGSAALVDMTNKLDGPGSVGAAGRIAEVQMEGLKGTIVRFKSASEGTFIAIGRVFAPALDTLVQALIRLNDWITNSIVPAFQRLDPRIQATIGIVAAFVAGLGPLLAIAGTLVTAIGGLVTAVGGAAGLAGAFGTAVAFLTGPAGIVLALGAALLAFEPVRVIVFTIAQILVQLFVLALQTAWNWVKTVTVSAYEWITSFDFVQLAIEKVGDWLGWIGTKLQEFSSWLGAGEADTITFGDAADDVATTEMPQLAAAIDGVSGVSLPDLDLALGNSGVQLDATRTKASELQMLGIIPLDIEVKRLDASLNAWIATQLNSIGTQQRMLDSFLAVTAQGVIPLRDELNTGLIPGIDLTQVSMGDLDGLVNNGFFDGLINSITGGGGVVDTFVAAFTGGGGALGAVQSFATQGLEFVLGMIPGIGAFASQFSGLIIGGIDKVWDGLQALGRGFSNLFGIGRSTSENIALTFARHWGIDIPDDVADGISKIARNADSDFQAMLLSLSSTFQSMGIEAVGGLQPASRATRDLFSAVQTGTLTSEQAFDQFIQVVKLLAPEFDNAGAEGQAQFLELIQLAQDAGFDMQALASVIGQDLVDQALNTDLSTAIRDADNNFVQWSDTAKSNIGKVVNEADTLTGKVKGIQDEFNKIDFSVPGGIQITPPGQGGLNLPSFQGGTHGAFRDFGSGTLAVLHGEERVVTRSEAASESGAMSALLSEVSQTNRLLRRLPKSIQSLVHSS